MTGDEPSVLELLIEHELAVKRLYEVFAVLFADRRDFGRALPEMSRDMPIGSRG